jgi:hypothetical protein
MSTYITIETATQTDSREIASMAGELLSEITNAIGVHAFNFDLEETMDRLRGFFYREKYFAFIARDEGKKAVGFRLVSGAKKFGVSRGWKRLEVTTPPLPQFDRTLEFYDREGFVITGGRKLKVAL